MSQQPHSQPYQVPFSQLPTPSYLPSQPRPVWSVDSDNGRIDYSQENTAVLENAYMAGQTKVEILIGSNRYHVTFDFSRAVFTQINLQTKKNRAVHRTPSTTTSSSLPPSAYTPMATSRAAYTTAPTPTTTSTVSSRTSTPSPTPNATWATAPQPPLPIQTQPALLSSNQRVTLKVTGESVI
eukprot:m.197425 g.197425  ORF g.197425 m.197425 type:complete len:182 (+) comp32660_c3_seq1:1634-2179(+)